MNAGDSIDVLNSGWNFNGNTARQFDKHIKRSVPLYEEGHHLIVQLSDFFLSNGAVCYDLGCATGTLLSKIAERNKHKKVEFIGVDVEEDMTNLAREKCGSNPGVNIITGNIVSMDFKKADLIVCYYTIQFSLPKFRQSLIDRIYQALNWGGAFICFEKVRAPDARFQDMMTSLYHDFKSENGFTAEEIFSKAKSLKGILEPFSSQGNTDLLKRAGFTDILSIMKYICFEGFLAIK